MPALVSLRKRFSGLVPELAKFGVVGLIGSVVDLGGADYLHVQMGVGPMVSKGLSLAAATVVTYLGSRFWTFRHRVNRAPVRELMLFAALNIVGMAIAECVIALVSYGFGMQGRLAYNAASVAGTGLGTIFRYFSYKKWVFLAGDGYQVPGEAGYEPSWERLDAADAPRRLTTSTRAPVAASRRGREPDGCPGAAGAWAGRPRTWRAWA